MTPQITLYNKPLLGSLRKRTRIENGRAAYEFSKPVQDLGREVILAILLDAKLQVIHVELLGFGTIDSSAVYPGELMRLCLIRQASSVILIHNHPSGIPDPSPADKNITRDIATAGEILGIKILDHIIIGQDEYYSLADHDPDIFAPPCPQFLR